jgi:exodeoxyribonuclease V alpha subunit
MIKGIGPVYARKLVHAFGEAAFDTIEESTERIQNGWAEPKVIREIMLFLHGPGIGTSRAVRSAPNASPWPSSGRSRTAP